MIEQYHPAASVFLGVLLEEIGSENESLMSEVLGLEPLLQHISKVEVLAATNDEPIRWSIADRGDASNHHMVTLRQSETAILDNIAVVSLTQGTITTNNDDSEMMIIPIDDAQPLQLTHLGSEWLNVKVLGERIDTSDHLSGRGTAVSINEDDVPLLKIFVNEYICIEGELHGLSDEVKAKFKDGSYERNRLNHLLLNQFLTEYDLSRMDSDLLEKHRDNYFFKPTAVFLDLASRFREIADLIKQTAATPPPLPRKPIGLSPSQELRFLATTSLGDDEQVHLLDKNITLSNRRDILSSLKQQVLRAHFFHGGSKPMSFSLDEGELAFDDDIGNFWSIDVEGKEYSSMKVKDTGSSAFHISGMPRNNYDFQRNIRMMQDRRPGYELLSPVEGKCVISLPYHLGIEIIGVLNFDELDNEELTDIFDNFFSKMDWALCPTIQEFSPVGVFPDTFKIHLKQVKLYTRSIKELLRAADLCDEP